MKNTMMTLVFAAATIFTINVNAQDNPSINIEKAKANIAGTWKVTCGNEFENQATVKFCEVCALKLSPANDMVTSVSSPTFTFKGDSLTIADETSNRTIHYKIYNEKHGIAFNYNDKAFLFRVFYVDADLILTDQDGYVIRLTKKQPTTNTKPAVKKK